MILLFFDIADGQARHTGYAGDCNDGCDVYVTIKIDGKQVYQTKVQNDTTHPVFNEIFETEPISVNSVIEFEMRDRNDGSMSQWKGNTEYYLNRQLFIANEYSKSKDQNSLVISTTLLDRKHPQGK